MIQRIAYRTAAIALAAGLAGAGLIASGPAAWAGTIGGEGLCQTQATHTAEQCSNVSLTVQLWKSSHILDSTTVTCGHSSGPCPAPRFVFSKTDSEFLPNNACTQMWAVVTAGSSHDNVLSPE